MNFQAQTEIPSIGLREERIQDGSKRLHQVYRQLWAQGRAWKVSFFFFFLIYHIIQKSCHPSLSIDAMRNKNSRIWIVTTIQGQFISKKAKKSCLKIQQWFIICMASCRKDIEKRVQNTILRLASAAKNIFKFEFDYCF